MTNPPTRPGAMPDTFTGVRTVARTERALTDFDREDAALIADSYIRNMGVDDANVALTRLVSEYRAVHGLRPSIRGEALRIVRERAARDLLDGVTL